jgi:Spy/CpxP family protein refolding chaperone
MRIELTACIAVLCCTAFPALAQHHGNHGSYAGQQQREIKALSGEETKQYLAGAGMGYARAAELNGYPGPMHVLELADALALSAQQRDATKQLMDRHKAEARAIGAKRVDAEKRLDALFSGGKAEEASIREAVRAAASLDADYRLSHLETHLRMKALLSDEQVARYNALRGYQR